MGHQRYLDFQLTIVLFLSQSESYPKDLYQLHLKHCIHALLVVQMMVGSLFYHDYFPTSCLVGKYSWRHDDCQKCHDFGTASCWTGVHWLRKSIQRNRALSLQIYIFRLLYLTQKCPGYKITHWLKSLPLNSGKYSIVMLTTTRFINTEAFYLYYQYNLGVQLVFY